MSKKQLSVAIMGLNEEGLKLLDLAARLDEFRIDAVADRDTELTEKIASRYNFKGYDDYRQLVIQNNFDCLLVCEGLYSCEQHLKAAIKKKFNILKLSPAARNFSEAAELAKAADENKIIFTVAAPGRFSQSHIKLRDFTESNNEKPLFITASCSYSRQNIPDWYYDPKLAGGGVLLRDCYGLIDRLISIFGLPEQIYASHTNTALDRQKKQAITEDIVVLLMRYADSFCINLVAARKSGADNQSQILKIQYRQYVVTVTDNSFSISGQTEIVEDKHFDSTDESQMHQVLKNFAAACLDRENNKPFSTIEQHMPCMAVIEAAYLSARTQMPESPQRILELAT